MVTPLVIRQPERFSVIPSAPEAFGLTTAVTDPTVNKQGDYKDPDQLFEYVSQVAEFLKNNPTLNNEELWRVLYRAVAVALRSR
jgi:hypothetical protein